MDARTCIRHAHANAAAGGRERGGTGRGREGEGRLGRGGDERRRKGAEDLDPRCFLLARIKGEQEPSDRTLSISLGFFSPRGEIIWHQNISAGETLAAAVKKGSSGEWASRRKTGERTACNQ